MCSEKIHVTCSGLVTCSDIIHATCSGLVTCSDMIHVTCSGLVTCPDLIHATCSGLVTCSDMIHVTCSGLVTCPDLIHTTCVQVWSRAPWQRVPAEEEVLAVAADAGARVPPHLADASRRPNPVPLVPHTPSPPRLHGPLGAYHLYRLPRQGPTRLTDSMGLLGPANWVYTDLHRPHMPYATCAFGPYRLPRS